MNIRNALLFIIFFLYFNSTVGVCKETLTEAELQKKIDLWAVQLSTNQASRILNDIDVQYGYRILRGTKIVPILIKHLQPMIDDTITSEGEGEYICSVIEILGQIGDRRAIEPLKKIRQRGAIEAIKDIENSKE